MDSLFGTKDKLLDSVREVNEKEEKDVRDSSNIELLAGIKR